MKSLLIPFVLSALASAAPSLNADPLLSRAVGDHCKAPEGSGTCQNKANCAGISYPTNLCPKDPTNVQCCVTIACTVPSVGSGTCRSRKNNGCASGTFHANHCPGSEDIQCCVKAASGKTPPDEPAPAPTPANPCTAAKYDELMFSSPIGTFMAAKTAGNPNCFDWNDDGCSCSPDDLGEFDFLASCKRHDFGYRNGKKLGLWPGRKERVDDNLKRDLYDVCDKFSGWESYKGVECRRIADIYVAAVKKFGKKTKREIENVVERDEIDGVVKRNALLGKRECDIPGF